MTKDEAMKLALEAFETWMQINTLEDAHTFEMITAPEAITALRTALEQPECNPHPDAPHGFDRDASHNMGRYVCECEGWQPEPVAMRYGWDGHGYQYIDFGSGSDWRERHKDGEPLYAAPPKPAQDLIVGYADSYDLDRAGHDFWVSRQPGKNTVPLYLYGHPPKIWQGLTDEEIKEEAKYSWADKQAFESAVWWAEEKLREKNGY